MKEQFCCSGCLKWKPKSPRHQNQRYCGEPTCQQARKSEWEGQKQKTDPDYRLNRKESYRRWHENHKDYWTKRRRSKQRMQSANKKPGELADETNQDTESNAPSFESVFAQTDASESSHDQGLRELPSSQSAQTDASIVKKITISNGCLIIPLELLFAQTDASKVFSSAFSEG